MDWPSEIICEVISYLTDPRDILTLLQTNTTLSTLAKQCVEILRYDNRDVNIPTTVDVNLVLKLRRLRVIKPYVRLRYLPDIILVAQMPFLSQVAIYLSNIDGDLRLESPR